MKPYVVLLVVLVLGLLPRGAAAAEPDSPAAIFTVTSTADSGAGSLREAILQANANGASKDTIRFAIAGAGPHVITLAAPLQVATQPVEIDGLTQPGASCSALPADLRIVLNGSGLVAGSDGLVVNGGNSLIRGLVIHRFPGEGVVLQGAGGNTIDCSYVGVNAAGNADLGNGGIGVFITNTPSNTITRSVVSGNGSYGIYIGGASANGNAVRGSHIGTDDTGTAAIPNGATGILVESAVNTAIGSAAAADRNVISGNQGPGVAVNGASSGSYIRNSYIGTNKAGAAALPNASGGINVSGMNGLRIGGTEAGAGNVISGNNTSGIVLQNNSGNIAITRNVIGLNATATAKLGNGSYGIYLPNASGVTIGDATMGNIISGNGQDGVFISGSSTNNALYGNFIGTNSSRAGGLGNGMFGVHISQASGNTVGSPAAGKWNVIANNNADGVYVPQQASGGNRISASEFFGNGDLGIDLGDNGVTLNDPGDGDVGGNGLQNFPVISSVQTSGAATLFKGTLNSVPGKTYRIELFRAGGCDPSGYGEGRNYLGVAEATTNGGGNASFSILLSTSGVTTGTALTATATDPQGNTSEFSACKTATALQRLLLPILIR